ncbi:MAG: RNA polymerase sigma factor [Devosiaceae bacterium]|nr:RNA polymerase sigma factor [Devosiaceae bacterium]
MLIDNDLKDINLNELSGYIKYLSSSFNLKKQDLEQEALIKIWQLKNKGIGKLKIYAYVKRSLRNHCIDTYRYSAKHCMHDEINDNQLWIEDDACCNNFGFHELIAPLKEDRKRLFCEFYINGLSFDELAVLFCCAVGTIKSRLHRGREIIKNNLEDIDDGEI